VPRNVLIKNRKASYDYFFIEEYTAGIQLLGTEVKSIAEGKVSLVDSFCYFDNNELYVKDLNISSVKNFSHDPLRVKKLLLNRKELNKLQKNLDKGITIIPVNIFSNNKGRIKIKIALAKGKKDYDKRNSIKEREASIEIRKYIK
jgi:SsrA-binding protein